ncbi:MAG: glycosyltransferase family 4 protein [Phycisphaerales bacterium]
MPTDPVNPVPTGSGSARKPVVALVRIVATPYWLHLHRRLDQEIPEIELHCLYTLGVGDQPWVLTEQDVRPVVFAGKNEIDPDRPVRTAISDWKKAGRMIAWMREHHAAAVVVSGYNRVGGPRIARWCRSRRIPCFVTGDSNVHADTTTGYKRRVKSAIVRWMNRVCSGALPFGTAGKKFYVKYGMDPARVFFFPAEPDYELIGSLSREEVAAAASGSGLRPGRRRIVYCGRLIRVKRVDLLIEAYAAIAGERPDWDLVIVGDGPLKASLQAMVPDPIKARVTWTGFIADQRRIAGIYRSCDVLALPSDHEPWALVVNEALAAGLAVVTSDVVGAADDLVRDGVNGKTFHRGDAEALARALRDVTAPGTIDSLKAGSRDVLAAWRTSGDPVAGFRAALRSAGVI